MLDLLEPALHSPGDLAAVSCSEVPMARLTRDQMPSCGFRSAA
ncbi:hypothetical protein GZL_01657 [Streptomyces sp. 769]|nr:hypothetical protein GZL_01657 [Streptomyces sp. 769]